jgi:hypothetical protein
MKMIRTECIQFTVNSKSWLKTDILHIHKVFTLLEWVRHTENLHWIKLLSNPISLAWKLSMLWIYSVPFP